MLKKAILKSFDSVNYQATVQVMGSLGTWLPTISVSRIIPAAEMVAGRKVALLFFEESNTNDAVVIAVYS